MFGGNETALIFGNLDSVNLAAEINRGVENAINGTLGTTLSPRNQEQQPSRPRTRRNRRNQNSQILEPAERRDNSRGYTAPLDDFVVDDSGFVDLEVNRELQEINNQLLRRNTARYRTRRRSRRIRERLGQSTISESHGMAGYVVSEPGNESTLVVNDPDRNGLLGDEGEDYGLPDEENYF